MRQLRVAHIGNFKPDSASGVDKTIVGLARHLGEHGIEVEVWHFTQRGREVRKRVEDGVPVYDLPVDKRIKGLCIFKDGVGKFVRDRSRSIDLFHFHSVFLRENLKLAALGVPYVVTPHSGYEQLVLAGRNRWAKAIWMQLWERPYLRRASLIQAVSPPELATIERLGLDVPICYVPNGIDEAVFERPVAPPSSRTDFVYLGRLAVEQKGLDFLLQAYAKATAEQGPLPRLVLAGPDYRGGLNRLVELATTLGVSEHVDIVGPVFGEDKWDLLARARLFVHTSRWEGMPFAVLEAAALGRPLLISPETNVAEPVTAANAGLLTNCTVDAIAEALKRASALSNDALDALGAGARSMVMENFSWQTIAGQLGAVYQALLAGQDPRLPGLPASR